jgi:hypothetical protein
MSQTCTAVLDFHANQNPSITNQAVRGGKIAFLNLALPTATSSADGNGFTDLSGYFQYLMGVSIPPVSGYVCMYDATNASLKFFYVNVTGTAALGIASGDFSAYTSVPALAWGY